MTVSGSDTSSGSSKGNSSRAAAAKAPTAALTAAQDVLVQLQVAHVAAQAAVRQLVVLGAVAALIGCTARKGSQDIHHESWSSML